MNLFEAIEQKKAEKAEKETNINAAIKFLEEEGFYVDEEIEFSKHVMIKYYQIAEKNEENKH